MYNEWSTALGLKFIHDRKYAHRDLKTENLLMDEKFDLKISDFGYTTRM